MYSLCSLSFPIWLQCLGRLKKHQKLNRLFSKKSHTKTEKSALARCYEKLRMRLHYATTAPGSETKKIENAWTHAATKHRPKTSLKSPKEFQEKKRQTLHDILIFDLNSLKINIDNIEKIVEDVYREIIRIHC